MQRRDKSEPWRRLYKTARWQRLRRLVCNRDGWVCQQTGVLLVGRYPDPDSAVADHIVPVRSFWWTDPDRFWDTDNLQTVAKEWHDSEKQKQERAGLR